MRPTLTKALARLAAMDAGNRSMLRAGRTAWNIIDRDVADEEYARLFPSCVDLNNFDKLMVAHGYGAAQAKED
jgi:hypothetical protein